VRLARFAIRAGGNPKRLVNAIEAQVWAIDKDQPMRRSSARLCIGGEFFIGPDHHN
jgi:hypothetical protein